MLTLDDLCWECYVSLAFPYCHHPSITLDTGTTPVTCDSVLSASITCDTSPVNPCIVSVTPTTSLTETCDEPTVSMSIKHNGGTTSVSLPLCNNKLDLSAYVGQTVTVCLNASYDCGSEVLMVSDECDIVVPNWTVDLTVNPSQPASGTNFQTITAGVGALQPGGRLTISPGTYTLGSNGESNRILTATDNTCIIADGVIIEAANLQQGAITLSTAASNVWLSGVTVNNARRWGILVQGDGHCLTDISATNTNNAGASGAIGIYLTSATDIHVDGAIVQNSQSSGFIVDNSSSNICITNSEAIENSNGFIISHVDDIRLLNNTSRNNSTQGMVIIASASGAPSNVLVEGGSYRNNDDVGIQIENDSDNVVLRGVSSTDNNIYQMPNTAGGNECGIWWDDATNGLIENCFVSGNQNGIRVATGLFGSTTNTANVIVRNNTVTDNQAQNTNPARVNRVQSLAFGHANGNQSSNVHVYGNTFARNGDASLNSAVPSQAVGGAESFAGELLNGVFINNTVDSIINNADSTARNVRWADSGNEFKRLDGNTYIGGPNATPFELGGTATGFAAYQAALAGLGHEQNSSATGSATTVDHATVTSVSGTTISLDCPGMFWEGDCVSLPEGNFKVISRNSTSITVDRAPSSAAAGQGVNLV